MQRTVPSEQLRQGIVRYTNNAGQILQVEPATITTLVDPLHIGPNAAVLKVFNAYPHPNDTSIGDNLNFIGYRFNAPVHSNQNTYIARLDYTLDGAGRHQLFWRGNLQNDSDNQAPQFPGQPPNSVHLNNSKGLAAGWTATLTPALVSTFRYGFTRYGEENTGSLHSAYTDFRGLDDPYGCRHRLRPDRSRPPHHPGTSPGLAAVTTSASVACSASSTTAPAIPATPTTTP